MKALTLIISILLLTVQTANARVTTLYPEAEPCEPSPFGTYCNVHPKALPYRKYKTPVSCGGTVVESLLTPPAFNSCNATPRLLTHVTQNHAFPCKPVILIVRKHN